MIAFSAGPTAVEIDATGSAERKNGSGRKRMARTTENTDAVEELVLSQEHAPATHRNMRHFEHKNDYFESDFLVLETSAFWYQLLVRNCAASFVEICNFFASQVVITVAVGVFNSDKLSFSYDDLYLGVSFWNTVCVHIRNCWIVELS